MGGALLFFGANRLDFINNYYLCGSIIYKL